MEIFNYLLAIVIGYFAAISPMIKITHYKGGIEYCNLLFENPIFDEIVRQLMVSLKRKYYFSMMYQVLILTYITMLVYGFLHFIVLVYIVSAVLTYYIVFQRKQNKIEEDLQELETGLEISEEEVFYECN